jgi:hypothetical protein
MNPIQTPQTTPLGAQSHSARQAHQEQLLADIADRSRQWSDHIHTWRQLGIATLVQVVLFVATPPVVAQGLADIPVRCDRPSLQQPTVAAAHEIVMQL